MFLLRYIFFFVINSHIIICPFPKPEKIKIKPNKIDLYILNKNQINFQIDSNNWQIDELIVNIASLNCIFSLDYDSENYIEEKEDFYYDKFFSLSIQKGKDPIKDIKINSLIKENDCYLVIDSIFKKSPPEIQVMKNVPTFIYFNNTFLNEIQLSYVLNDFDYDDVVAFSFQSKDNMELKITILCEGEFIKSKIIYDSTNIVLTYEDLTKFINYHTLEITIILEASSSFPLVFNIFDKNNNIKFLKRNFFNKGFISSNTPSQYYYMVVYADEEGEIMLNDKTQNGKLIASLKNKTQNIPSIRDFPNENSSEALTFNKHYQRLIFNSSDTKACKDEGCFLLITYYQEVDKTDNENNTIGFEFSLLTKIWSKDEFIPQLIYIPLNEYIFGYFNKYLINHYYYLFFSNKDNIENIIVEIKGHYIEAFLGKGKRSLNTYRNMEDSEELDTTNEKVIFNLSATDYLKDNDCISLAFKSQDFLSDILSFYYFRVIAVKKNEILVYPLDSNFENNCKPIKQSNIDKYYCLFLLKNDYNLFSQKFSFYTANQYENYYIIYKTIKN